MKARKLPSLLTASFLSVWLLLAFTGSDALAGPGAWDQSYAATISSGPVYAMALQPNGELVVGGAFTSVDGSFSRVRLARLFSDGSLDSTFFATGNGVSSTVWSLAVQTDGRIVIGGDFTSINGTIRTRIARLNANGTVDGSFLPTNTINSSVLALAVQTNNAVIIGGTFANGPFPSYNARLNADGSTDTSFSSYPNGPVYAIAIQSDGKIIIGGAFYTVNGASRFHIARLNPDGSLDNAFQNGLTGASSNVRCIQIQSDGKILIGGDFTTVNNTGRNFVARLNSDGSIDNGFGGGVLAGIPGANAPVYALAVQPDNNIVVGGLFTGYNSANLSHVARIYPDGTRDTTFTNFGINNTVQALAIQNDGKLLIGGAFTTINNTNWPSLGRLYGNLYPPEFIVQPASRNTNVGANVTFSAQVSNPTTTSFQWRLNGNNISGATDTTYSLYNVQLSDAGNYSVFVSDAVGGTTSSNALLQVGIAPAFTSQPSSLSVTQGQSASFSVTATGTPLNYFWKKNGAFISGQTNSSLNFASVVPTNAAFYTCQVSNFLGNVTSTNVMLTVYSPPNILTQPVGQTVGVGSNIFLFVTVNGTLPLSYQWLKNGNSITNFTGSVSISNAQTNDAGDYSVVITNSLGSITSSVATVSVVYYPPTISQQPVGGNVLVGSNFTMNASAAGTAPFNWQWRTNGAPIPGANDSSYAINSAQLTDAGSYDVVVSNFTGSVTSSVAVVNVGYVPVVAQQPLSLTNIVGGTANFSCIVTGSATINLQWTYYSSPLTDATNATLTITNLQPGNIGYYALTATNIFGGTISSNAALNLNGYALGIWNGLVAYYPFNGNANDASGNGNNATNVQATLSVDRFGNVNQAYSFNGSNNYIGFPQVPTSQTDNWSVIAWINPAVLNQLGTAVCVGYDDGTGATANGYAFSISEATGITGSLFTGVFGGMSWYSSGFTFPSSNQWYQIAMLRQAGTTTFFVNGVATPNAISDSPLVPTSFSIGSASGIRFFNGIIDEVRIYNRALSSNEVATLYTLESQSNLQSQQIFLNANLGAGPNFNLNLTGIPGQSYVLQTATNLTSPIQWLPVLTNTADTNGVWQFMDTNLDSSQKFYRVTTP